MSLFFGGGGGPKSILFSLFWNNKASSKYIYTLNGVHIWVFFNTESFNERAPHLSRPHIEIVTIVIKPLTTLLMSCDLVISYDLNRSPRKFHVQNVITGCDSHTILLESWPMESHKVSHYRILLRRRLRGDNRTAHSKNRLVWSLYIGCLYKRNDMLHLVMLCAALAHRRAVE